MNDDGVLHLPASGRHYQACAYALMPYSFSHVVRYYWKAGGGG